LSAKHDFMDRAREFTASVRAMSAVRVVQRWGQPPLVPSAPPVRSSAPPTIVAIAASTGGPGAVYRVLTELPADFPVPILVVQHIASGFVSGFAAWLDGASQLTVKVAEQAETLQAGHVYVAPDDHHLGVSGRRSVLLSRHAAIAGFRPSATFLFDSVAEQHRSGAIALILTGMGEDGLPGLQKVRELGGRVLAQDAETSVVFGMPGAAVAAGLAEMTLPIDMLAGRLRRLVSETGVREGERL
jgi:two-component system chemotaxis response regulator CheB